MLVSIIRYYSFGKVSCFIHLQTVFSFKLKYRMIKWLEQKLNCGTIRTTKTPMLNIKALITIMTWDSKFDLKGSHSLCNFILNDVTRFNNRTIWKTHNNNERLIIICHPNKTTNYRRQMKTEIIQKVQMASPCLNPIHKQMSHYTNSSVPNNKRSCEAVTSCQLHL